MNQPWSNVPRWDSVENHHFTQNYEQPEAYRFCQDSVIFPWLVARDLKCRQAEGVISLNRSFKVADVCAGCGIIGLELSHHVPEVATIDFIEIQDVFHSPFEQNVMRAGRSMSDFHFVNESYETLLTSERASTYDLIVANPPYFFRDEGKLSSSEVQNRARFFIDSSLERLVRGATNALKRGGAAYLLVKSGERHGRASLGQLMLWCEGDTKVTALARVRETCVVRIDKPKVAESHTSMEA